MSRLSAPLLVVALLVASISAAQKLRLTRDEDFIRKQEFVYQLLWRPNELANHFSDTVERAGQLQVEDLRDLPINQNAAETFITLFKNNMLHPKNLSATAFNRDHLAEIRVGFDLLYSAANFDTFALLSLYTNQVQNQILWFFEFVVATMQRVDTRRVRFPNFHEALPQYAFNNDVLDRRDAIVNGDDCSASRNVIIGEYSSLVSRPTPVDPEALLSYFTEDIGLGNFYFFLATADFPFWLNSLRYNLPYRLYQLRGERYFNDHKQFLARYYLERLANGLSVESVEDVDFEGTVQTGYYPEMRDYNGVDFLVRPVGASIAQRDDAELVLLVEDRLTTSADQGTLQTPNGQLTDANNQESFFNALMNSIQGNGDSPNLRYYRSLDILARHILGFSPESSSKFDVIISALENLNADVRDPMYYRMYKNIVDLGFRYKSKLQPYGEEELGYPGVTIEDVNIDEITTYFDEFDSLIGKHNCSGSDETPTFVRQRRLNHEDFKVRLTVNSEAMAKAVVRLFIGPKFGADGEPVIIKQAERAFFQLDKFVVKLKEGENRIVRKDLDFVYQVPDSPRSDQLYSIIERSANEDAALPYFEQPYGYPRRLMIPRGKSDGLTLRLFAIVTALDEVQVPDSLIAGEEFNDGRALGYPFDRPIGADIEKLKLGNVKVVDVNVYHRGN